MMEKYYCYPAIFEYYEDKITFDFPNFKEAFSFGDDMMDALKSAKEVLTLTLRGRLADEEDIPEPTELKNLKLKENQFTSLVEVSLEAKVKYDKKTLTIPHEINVAATKAGINFSQILQKALLQELDN